jgi:plasmid stabilization system protein ParE
MEHRPKPHSPSDAESRAMMPDITFHRDAAEELQASVLYYESVRPGLGEELLQAVDATLAQIRRAPLRYPVVHPGIRRSLLRRFPYGIYYRIAVGQIRVIAVFHAKRDPMRWKTRE